MCEFEWQRMGTFVNVCGSPSQSLRSNRSADMNYTDCLALCSNLGKNSRAQVIGKGATAGYQAWTYEDRSLLATLHLLFLSSLSIAGADEDLLDEV